ncbi:MULTISPECIES: metal-sensing transcriptional repressor [unclassified Paenibacillus]|uniref:metal-sensing transcriptional repressor n=1 Tax=unclassified Paenibacillus TaxID=185978 RepID=UPI001AE1A0EA|nr:MULTISPECIES: metal-sensing transcriptional repressor [unclassified Paenibacillus]MBP1154221.1 DNA-binding FrmR family transcriptional regulator [Paenibacillus sp. PvP091]MBP1170394.1 DNA-binding FrmR family transcriptional regulator [Paenibacillus sp. PvR098]MBP2441422.1 DNA-binding FrmR family transcriptional regulator [Paenibacillus sp. PvP052]
MGANHKHRKQVENRLARIEGHVRAIKEMSKEHRDCGELLIQIAAVRSALDNVGKLILKDHLESCIIEGVETGDKDKVLTDLEKALDKFIR